jgi:hypothetical protein
LSRQQSRRRGDLLEMRREEGAEPMIVFGIDPGPTRTAVVGVQFTPPQIQQPTIFVTLLEPNEFVRGWLWSLERPAFYALEQVAMGGMIAGAEVFETCYWSGRFAEAILGGHEDDGAIFRRIPRTAIKHHLCGNTRSKDANVRQAIIDRYGPGKDTAIGKKKQPGPLYGLKADLWAALAVALTCIDQR